MPEATAICYLGHYDCYDRHEAERRADEADWEEDFERYGDYAPGWWAPSVAAYIDERSASSGASDEQEATG